MAPKMKSNSKGDKEMIVKALLKWKNDDLSCRNCGKFDHHQYSAGKCGHIYCSTCCSEFKGMNTCPFCSMPTNSKDVQKEDILMSVATHCEDLIKLMQVPKHLLVDKPKANSKPEEEERPAKKAKASPPFKVPKEKKVTRTKKIISEKASKPVEDEPRAKTKDVDDNSDNGDDDFVSQSSNNSTPRKSSRIAGKPRPSEDPKEWRNCYGETHLHIAVNKKDPKEVRNRIFDGVDVNVKNNKGFTALHAAAQIGYSDIIVKLIEAEADLNSVNNDLNTPLHLACLEGHAKVVSILLNSGADKEILNSQGKKAINLASKNTIKTMFKEMEQEFKKLSSNEDTDGSLNKGKGSSTDSPQLPTTTLKKVKNQRVKKQSSKNKFDPPTDAEKDQTPMANITDSKKKREKSSMKDQMAVSYTSLTEQQVKEIEQFRVNFDIPVRQSVSDEAEYTHLVTSTKADGLTARTLKYLKGLLENKWILSFDWVQACLDANKIVDEAEFEIKGTPKQEEKTWGAPHRSRESQLKLFKTIHFYLDGKFEAISGTPGRSDLEALIAAGGGTLVKSKPKLKALCKQIEEGDKTLNIWSITESVIKIQKEFIREITVSQLFNIIQSFKLDG